MLLKIILATLIVSLISLTGILILFKRKNKASFLKSLISLAAGTLLGVSFFELLPEGKPMVDTKDMVQPGLNIESKTFLAEIIREKAFLFLRREVPYRVTAIVDEVVERGSGALYIKARILTTEDRYKAMIIGAGGVMIKEISMASRKELETATSKKVFLDLTVETNEHWLDFV